MKTLFAFFVALFVISGTAFSQSINFRIENDLLKDVSGVTLTPDSPSPPFVYGGTFSTYSPSQLEDEISSIRSTASTNPDLAASELQNLLADFTQWGVISPSPKIGPSLDWDWFSELTDLPPGAKVYMVIVTDGIDSISSSTQVGIVSSADNPVPLSGAFSIGFISGNERWNEFFMGTSGSLTLEAIPEPRAYAALFGVCVLALAVIRRRRK